MDEETPHPAPAPDPAGPPVRRENLREQIYGDLLRRLQRSEIGPEARLVDTEIAARWGTSRMPAREALLQLVNEGYLARTTRGFAVPVLSDADIRDIFEVRRLIEPRAAALAARDLTAEAAARLAAAFAEAGAAAAAGDAERMIRANIAFRAAWLGCVGNRRLATTIARFVDQVQAVRLETLRRAEARAVVVAGLEGLLAAFRARDPVAAGDRMTAFIASAESAFFAARAARGGDAASAAAAGPAAAPAARAS